MLRDSDLPFPKHDGYQKLNPSSNPPSDTVYFNFRVSENMSCEKSFFYIADIYQGSWYCKK